MFRFIGLCLGTLVRLLRARVGVSCWRISHYVNNSPY
jgi:hypothetical protein